MPNSGSLLRRCIAQADKCPDMLAALQAGLIIVYASSGRTASLVAKYRPKMPILTLVVPHLKSSALKWELQGRSLARQCLIMRGQSPCSSHLFVCHYHAPQMQNASAAASHLALRMGVC